MALLFNLLFWSSTLFGVSSKKVFIIILSLGITIGIGEALFEIVLAFDAGNIVRFSSGLILGNMLGLLVAGFLRYYYPTCSKGYAHWMLLMILITVADTVSIAIVSIETVRKSIGAMGWLITTTGFGVFIMGLMVSCFRLVRSNLNSRLSRAKL